MATPQEKLAESLEALRALQDRHVVAIRAADLSRTHRERLLRAGFLAEVIRGWYIPANPNEDRGDTTPWYTSFWDFCGTYLRKRFGNNWCIGPEQSLCLHAGNLAVPHQLLIRAPKGSNKPIALSHGTSIFDIRAAMPAKKDVTEVGNLRTYAPAAALIEASPAFFTVSPTDARAILAAIADPSNLLGRLLEGGHSVIAGRLAGGFRNIGRERIAENIVKTMSAAGYNVREHDPFDHRISFALPRRETSPYASRIPLMWQSMREDIAANFPPPPGKPTDRDSYIKRVDEAYVADAYHSLSIEGYRVSPALIERVRDGIWNPTNRKEDHDQQNAMAARGYYLAFEAVKKSVQKVLANANPGTVADHDHSDWYRGLFAPSVEVGLIRAADLAGYRRDRVFIRRSQHTPLPPEAVADTMAVYFEMLEGEQDPAVRAVLGHFVFVYIHPYMDGNGRMGRFLMNVMLSSGGYPWTIVPLERRDIYMAALEEASVRQNIVPFTQLLADLVTQGMAGKPAATVPRKS